jgi:hypothetical protein
MPLFVVRLRNADCLVVSAANRDRAEAKVHKYLAGGEIATVRRLPAFAAHFALADDGSLHAVMLDPKMLLGLHRHEYPMLRAAVQHSFADFDAPEAQPRARAGEPVLFDPEAEDYRKRWEQRDKDIIKFAVQQERSRFAN